MIGAVGLIPTAPIRILRRIITERGGRDDVNPGTGRPPPSFVAVHMPIRLLPILFVFASCAWGAAPIAHAQPSHADVLTRLTLGCVDPVITDLTVVLVDSDGVPGFIETGLLSEWSDRETTVRLAGSGQDNQSDRAVDSAAPELVLSVDEAGIRYRRIGGGRLERTAAVTARYRLTTPDGELVTADTCSPAASDTLSVDQARRLNDTRYSQTQPDIPSTSRWRRVLEPVAVIGAAAVGTYLFFNRRSRRADN